MTNRLTSASSTAALVWAVMRAARLSGRRVVEARGVDYH